MDGKAFKKLSLSQLEASLAMLRDAIRACPPAHWDGIVGTHPFWHVVYHTLCYADCYCAPSRRAWKPHATFHPLGRKELVNEHPSRRFEKEELLEYLTLCRKRARAALQAETSETLAGPSGFPWARFSRAELYPYNTRHIQHHTGQLTASLRRHGHAPARWVMCGWR